MIAVVASAVAIVAGTFSSDPPRLIHHHHRHKRPTPPMRPALASWYDTDGTGACGVGSVQSGYRFASLFLGCGIRVRFCHAGRCATAIMSDRGPYIYSRQFDLNANLRDALACGGLCWLRYRVLR